MHKDDDQGNEQNKSRKAGLLRSVPRLMPRNLAENSMHA